MVLLERCDQILAHAIDCAELEFAAGFVEHVDGAGVSAGQLHRLGDDGVEHGLEVERGIHRLADLAQRVELLDRLGELAGAQLDLALEAE